MDRTCRTPAACMSQWLKDTLLEKFLSGAQTVHRKTSFFFFAQVGMTQMFLCFFFKHDNSHSCYLYLFELSERMEMRYEMAACACSQHVLRSFMEYMQLVKLW